MKKIIPALFLFFIIETPGISRLTAGTLEQYTADINAAYKHYVDKSYLTALEYYEKSEKTAGSLSENYLLNAQIGVQNCLVILERYSLSAKQGEKILSQNPENSHVLANTAFSYFSIGEYKNAIKYYLKMIQQNETNQAALEGLAWSYYYQGDIVKAKIYAKRSLMNASNVKGLKEICDFAPKNSNEFELTGFVTYLGYGSPVKRDGISRDVLLTFKRNGKHRFDFDYGAVTIDYVSPVLTRLNEDDYTLSYSLLSSLGTTLTYKKIRTNDTSLGEGNLFFANIDKNGFILSGSYSNYNTSKAFEGGAGVRFAQNHYSFNFLANGIFRDNISNDRILSPVIKNISNYKNFYVLTTGINIYEEHFNMGLQGTFGNNCLHVADYGFVAYNSPDEMNVILKGMMEYSQKTWALGYGLTYAEGLHYTTNSNFSMVAHVFKLGLKF